MKKKIFLLQGAAPGNVDGRGLGCSSVRGHDFCTRGAGAMFLMGDSRSSSLQLMCSSGHPVPALAMSNLCGPRAAVS
jgi:hypothetical protein